MHYVRILRENPRMLCAKLCWNWPSGSEKILKISSMYFRYLIVIISPCTHGKGGPSLYWNKLESPAPKDALCQALLKLAHWFLRRRFSFKVNVVSLFRYYFPFENGWILQLNKLESSPPKYAFCQVCLKLAHCLWRRRWKCEKFTDRQTDRHTTGDQNCLLELSAQAN